MSISDNLNNWFDQFIAFEDVPNKTEQELWTLHSLDSLIQLFEKVYGEIPNKPATSKIHTFLGIMVVTIKTNDKHKQYLILNSLYRLKNTYSSLLTSVAPAEYYLNYLPHNFKVFYTDLISVFMQFPEFKALPNKVASYHITQEYSAQEKIANEDDALPTKEKLINLLAIIPYNTEFDKKLLQAKELILNYVKARTETILELAEIIDELATPKYDYLRKDKNLLRTLTGTFTRNHAWSIILNDIKQKALDILKMQIATNQEIKDETWNLAESILNERAMAAVIFKDQYLEELAMLRRKYLAKMANSEKHVM